MSRKALTLWSEVYGEFRKAELELLTHQLRGIPVPAQLVERAERLQREADELFEQAHDAMLDPSAAPSRWAGLAELGQP